MYTQCPDCSAAFRVTAEVLKQAAGKVRCGSCSHTFNALEFLSETLPKQVAKHGVEAPIPELFPDSARAETGIRRPVSAEQSATLLKTLEQLGGSDVRIEDTGVEWRVLDPDDDPDPLVDELFEESPTPVDEFLTETPTRVDAGEIFETSLNALAETAVNELRFDDDTPLPDEFDVDEMPSEWPESGHSEHAASEIETRQPDAGMQPYADAADEQGEWADILDEFEHDIAPAVLPLDAELAAIEEAEQRLHEAESQRGEATADDSVDEADRDTENDETRGEEAVSKSDDAGNELAHADPDSETVDSETDDNDTRDQPLEEEAASKSDDAGDELANADPDSETDDNDTRDQPLGEKDDEHSAALESGPVFSAIAAAAERSLQDTDNSDTSDSDESLEEIKAGGVSEKLIIEADISPGFESIVMEGEFVSSALDNDKRAADIAAAAALAEQAQKARDADQVEKTFGRSRSTTAALVALVALLLVQVVHQSREALLTVPVLQRAVGPLYRAIGQPVSPAWDVTGWRFEATTGNVDEGDGQLTVNSRLGNKSDVSLPYPLIGITLTDRYEETLGGSVLQPFEYLPGNLDPQGMVNPGNSFNAVISILSPTESAAGFKLEVCYRLSDTQLRCAANGFR